MTKPKRPKPNQLDIIATDRLLWSLGGFAPARMETNEPRAYRDKSGPLEPSQIRRIVELAQQPKSIRTGDAARFAEAQGISAHSVYVMVHRHRKGVSPRSWQYVLDAVA